MASLNRRQSARDLGVDFDQAYVNQDRSRNGYTTNRTHSLNSYIENMKNSMKNNRSRKELNPSYRHNILAYQTEDEIPEMRDTPSTLFNVVEPD